MGGRNLNTSDGIPRCRKVDRRFRLATFNIDVSMGNMNIGERPARRYSMSTRGLEASQTRERIIDACESLVGSQPLEGVTLRAIAQGAGVTVQTVLRHMESREGVLQVVAERVAKRVRSQREMTAPGDVDAAIAGLVAHYEAEGRLMLNLLSQETGADPYAAQAAEQGRAYHRQWVTRCLLPPRATPDEQTVDALVVATDLYVWKLLRVDMRRSSKEVVTTMVTLVKAVGE